jgi:hypothetical protein
MSAPTPCAATTMTDKVLAPVTLEGVTVSAALNALLAIESYAERMWPDHKDAGDQTRKRNELAAIVLPLRAAMDEATEDAMRSHHDERQCRELWVNVNLGCGRCRLRRGHDGPHEPPWELIDAG